MTMYRVTAILLTLTVASASVHSDLLRVRRAVDTYVGILGAQNRVKRQALTTEVSPRQCFNNCMGEFKMYLRNITGGELDLKSIQNGFFDKDKLFNDADILPQFCGEYKEVKTCTAECGDFDGAEKKLDGLKGLDFICVDNYDDFLAYQPCYANLSSTDAESACKDSCGGEDYVLEQVAKLDNFGGKPDFGALMAIMGNLCGFISCHLDCQRPNYVEVCGTEAPADLLDEFIGTTIGTAMEQLSSLGLGELIPPQCTAITNGGDVQVAEDDVEVDFSQDSTKNSALEKEKLVLEIKVLNKQYEKLEYEIENLQLERQVLQAQVAQLGA